MDFFLIKSYMIPVGWGVILAVATEPFIRKSAKMIGGRKIHIGKDYVLRDVKEKMEERTD